MSSPREPIGLPGSPGTNDSNTMDTNAIDAPTPSRAPTPAPWVSLPVLSLPCRLHRHRHRHRPPLPLTTQEQDEIFNRASSSSSELSQRVLLLTQPREGNTVGGAPQESLLLPTTTSSTGRSPGRHILHQARPTTNPASPTASPARPADETSSGTSTNIIIPNIQHRNLENYLFCSDGDILNLDAQYRGMNAHRNSESRSSSAIINGDVQDKKDLCIGSNANNEEDDGDDDDELLILPTPAPKLKHSYGSTITGQGQAVVSRTWKEVWESKGRRRGVGGGATGHGNTKTKTTEREEGYGGGGDGDESEDSSDGGAVLLPKVMPLNQDSDDSDDGPGDGGAPLFTASSEKDRLGTECWGEDDWDKILNGPDLNPSTQEVGKHKHHHQIRHGHRANSNTKADAAQLSSTRHRRPGSLLPSFRSGQTEVDADASPEYFSTTFRFKRAEARLRVLSRIPPSNPPDTIDHSKDDGQQAKQPGPLRHQSPGGLSISNADHLPVASNIRQQHSHNHEPRIKSLQFPRPIPTLPITRSSSSSRAGLAQPSEILPPSASQPYELLGSRAILAAIIIITGDATTTGDTTTGDTATGGTTQTTGTPTIETPTTGTCTTTITGNSIPSSSTPETLSSSSQLGPFPLPASTLAVLASSQASFERLTTPKFHPASRNRHDVQIQAGPPSKWTDINLGSGPKEKKTKKTKEEEEDDDDKEDGWEMVKNPADKYREGV
ncbi:hypothetical protein QBC32DRAFT_390479 [Pseudoneurospora amorphoporcata]|uniref:Uncharacterized protein n=1 Tax=Pseudoneurospora amorphoporcata TaxID=241081 RepID=A0AAN6NUT9_9PEZI|nr:hypothetical protein QBC32DRAFT_390479 [Pseudoneurospora amorphoporcata]